MESRTDLLARYVLILLALITTTVVLYYGRDLFILLFVPALLAFLTLPLSNRLDKAGLPVWVGALASTLSLVVLGGLLVLFLAGQFADLGRDMPALGDALGRHVEELRGWVEQRFDLDRDRQEVLVKEEAGSMAKRMGEVLMGFASATGATLAILVPIPLILFFLLLLRGRFSLFLHKLAEKGNGTALRVTVRTSRLARKWMRGVLIVMAFLAVVNSIGFLMLGLEHAILLGVTAAVLNVIPYVGPWIGAALAMLIALLTKDSGLYALGTLGVILFSQFIDNNFVTPKVVGSSVSINPLASLVALFAGGMLWGVMGMVLAIPIMGILKVVCDEIPGLEAYGFLLGEERDWPEEERLQLPFTKSKPKAGSEPKA
ncbi:MAG: AI-2E family transporter [Flavobacteriales bacterium]|nr:AI-2E family transporter [Flavobacteriales bacterium]